MITRQGRKEAVVLSLGDDDKLLHVSNFGRSLASFPGDPEDILPQSGNPSRALDP